MKRVQVCLTKGNILQYIILLIPEENGPDEISLHHGRHADAVSLETLLPKQLDFQGKKYKGIIQLISLEKKDTTRMEFAN